MPDTVEYYYIMHLDRRVAKIGKNGLCRVYYKTFMPYDLVLDESADFDARLNNLEVFRHWCASRTLTLDRQYARELLNSIGASQSQTDAARANIALSYHCLSLVDVYWVKKQGEKLLFGDINLYSNHLDNAFVDISLRGRQMTVTNAYLIADSLSVGGSYPKAWYRADDGFYLYKDGGIDAVRREVLASRICRCFKLNQVLYELGEFEGQAISKSHIITDPNYSLATYEAFDLYCANRDKDTISAIKKLDGYNYYMMNIVDYLVGNTDRHWQNWGVLVSTKANRPVRLYDLMDFNRAFNSYDTVDGANCLTAKGHLTQRQAAEEAVKAVGLNQISEIPPDIWEGAEQYLPMFEQRLGVLKSF